MKPFDLEAAKAGKPVCTISGKKARIICYDAKNEFYPLVCLVETSPGYEENIMYSIEGKYFATRDDVNPKDLCMADEHHEGYVNIWKNTENILECGYVYELEEEAINSANNYCFPYKKHIATVKIEWSE